MSVEGGEEGDKKTVAEGNGKKVLLKQSKPVK